MVQFYFLSVLANLLAGITLSRDYLVEKIPFLKTFQELLGKRGVRATLGFVTAIVGVFKLIVQPVGRSVPVVGDVIPALMGITLGGALLVDFFKERVTVSAETLDKVQAAVKSYQVPLGMAGIGISLLHFIIPSALLL